MKTIVGSKTLKGPRNNFPRPVVMDDRGIHEQKMLNYLTAYAPPGNLIAEEFRFHIPAEGEKQRQWRFDFAIPNRKIAFEVEGGIWTGGRHINPAGFEGDCIKYNVATLQGWRVFRIPPKFLNDDYLLPLFKDLFKE